MRGVQSVQEDQKKVLRHQGRTEPRPVGVQSARRAEQGPHELEHEAEPCLRKSSASVWMQHRVSEGDQRQKNDKGSLGQSCKGL